VLFIINIILFTFLQLSSSQFVFKKIYNIPSSDINNISYFLEKESIKFKDKWDISKNKKIEIIFCESVDEFCRYTKANRRLAAFYKRDKIYLQPLKILKSRNILFQVMKHELIHALLDGEDKLILPRWFNEAFTIYESGEQLRLTKKSKIKIRSLNDFNIFLNSKNYNDIETAYFYLGNIMVFLFNEYGEEKIKNIINCSAGKNFNEEYFNIFGESLELSEQKIIKYLKKF
jgi:hypothetical protein